MGSTFVDSLQTASIIVRKMGGLHGVGLTDISHIVLAGHHGLLVRCMVQCASIITITCN